MDRMFRVNFVTMLEECYLAAISSLYKSWMQRLPMRLAAVAHGLSAIQDAHNAALVRLPSANSMLNACAQDSRLLSNPIQNGQRECSNVCNSPLRGSQLIFRVIRRLEFSMTRRKQRTDSRS